jgi:hypothetical protein
VTDYRRIKSASGWEVGRPGKNGSIKLDPSKEGCKLLLAQIVPQILLSVTIRNEKEEFALSNEGIAYMFYDLGKRRLLLSKVSNI